MKTNKHYLSSIALSACALFFSASVVSSQTPFPDRPITMVLPVGAGGSHDLHARGMTSELGKILGQSVIIKLMPGGAGVQGTELVASSPPDGYTILFTDSYRDQMLPQTQKLPFNPLTDFKAVARINQGVPVFEVPAGSPFKTLNEFVAYAKANPGKINFGHSGVWGPLYVPALQLLQAADLKVNFIPHKGGGPLLRAALAGQDDISALFPTQARPYVQDGKLVSLAVVGTQRLSDDPDFKDVPTTAELGYPKVNAIMDRIVLAPAGTPPERLEVLREAFEKLSKSEAFTAYLAQIGEHVQYMSGEEYDLLRPEQYKVYGELIKEMSAK